MFHKCSVQNGCNCVSNFVAVDAENGNAQNTDVSSNEEVVDGPVAVGKAVGTFII